MGLKIGNNDIKNLFRSTYQLCFKLLIVCRCVDLLYHQFLKKLDSLIDSENTQPKLLLSS